MRCKRFHFHPHIPEWEKEALAFSTLDKPRRDLDIFKCWVITDQNVLVLRSFYIVCQLVVRLGYFWLLKNVF